MSDARKWRERELELENMGVIGFISFYSQAIEYLKSHVKTRFKYFVEFPYVFDDSFLPDDSETKWDINLQYYHNGYPFRRKVLDTLLNKKDKYNIFHIDKSQHYRMIEGNNDPLNSYFRTNHPAKNFAKLLNSSLITIADGYTKYSPNSKYWNLSDSDLFNARYPQALASQTVLFCPEITSTHIEPLIDGVHYVKVDIDNFVDKIDRYINDKDKLKTISKNATEWAIRNCSKDVVGKRLIDSFKQILADLKQYNNPTINISIGELVDKVTILEIKLERIKDRNKLSNIRLEYDMLNRKLSKSYNNNKLYNELKGINLKLWDIENHIRQKESEKDFGKEFLELARNVYRFNDIRAKLKYKINIESGSVLTEEKEYTKY
jgi:hypothetical protein